MRPLACAIVAYCRNRVPTGIYCNSALAKFVQLPAFVVILLQHFFVAHDVTLCGLPIRRFVTNFATKPSLHNVSKVSASAPTSATASASAPSQHQHSIGAMQHPGRHRSGVELHCLASGSQVAALHTPGRCHLQTPKLHVELHCLA